MTKQQINTLRQFEMSQYRAVAHRTFTINRKFASRYFAALHSGATVLLNGRHVRIVGGCDISSELVHFEFAVL